jgi:hypothetical protein
MYCDGCNAKRQSVNLYVAYAAAFGALVLPTLPDDPWI